MKKTSILVILLISLFLFGCTRTFEQDTTQEQPSTSSSLEENIQSLDEDISDIETSEIDDLEDIEDLEGLGLE